MTVQRVTATIEVPPRDRRGPRCSECVARLSARVEEVPGVLRVERDAAGDLHVEYDAAIASSAGLRAVAREYGAQLVMKAGK